MTKSLVTLIHEELVQTADDFESIVDEFFPHSKKDISLPINPYNPRDFNINTLPVDDYINVQRSVSNIFPQILKPPLKKIQKKIFENYLEKIKIDLAEKKDILPRYVKISLSKENKIKVEVNPMGEIYNHPKYSKLQKIVYDSTFLTSKKKYSLKATPEFIKLYTEIENEADQINIEKVQDYFKDITPFEQIALDQLEITIKLREKYHNSIKKYKKIGFVLSQIKRLQSYKYKGPTDEIEKMFVQFIYNKKDISQDQIQKKINSYKPKQTQNKQTQNKQTQNKQTQNKQTQNKQTQTDTYFIDKRKKRKKKPKEKTNIRFPKTFEILSEIGIDKNTAIIIANQLRKKQVSPFLTSLEELIPEYITQLINTYPQILNLKGEPKTTYIHLLSKIGFDPKNINHYSSVQRLQQFYENITNTQNATKNNNIINVPGFRYPDVLFATLAHGFKLSSTDPYIGMRYRPKDRIKRDTNKYIDEQSIRGFNPTFSKLITKDIISTEKEAKKSGGCFSINPFYDKTNHFELIALINDILPKSLQQYR